MTRAEVCIVLDRLMKKIDDVNTSTAISIEERIKRIEENLCLY